MLAIIPAFEAMAPIRMNIGMAESVQCATNSRGVTLAALKAGLTPRSR